MPLGPLPVVFDIAAPRAVEPARQCPAARLALVQQMVRQVGLAESINRNCPIFKLHMPSTEADHVINIAFNMFAGGTCLEHLELRRSGFRTA